MLTIPEGLPAGRDNGLLQVWEIFESVRLDADLVVLSACETALGRELSGEGMIGLTRAFQYAGARSVVASLWSVADAGHSRADAALLPPSAAGKPKDEALRAAQIELIRSRSGSHGRGGGDGRRGPVLLGRVPARRGWAIGPALRRVRRRAARAGCL